MNETLHIIWRVLDPFPGDDPNAMLVTAFTIFILSATLLVTYHEFLLRFRAHRVAGLVRSLMRNEEDDEFFRNQQDVDDVARDISKACPQLGSGARKLAESTYETEHAIFIVQAAREFFDSELIRATGRGAFLSPTILRATPGLLMQIGIFGTFVGLVKGLGDYQAALAAADFEEGIRVLLGGLSVSFRTSVWGLLASMGVKLVGSWSQGAGDRAVDQLVGFLDENLVRGVDQGLMVQMVRIQNMSRKSMAETAQAVHKLVELQDESHERLSETSARIETLGSQIGDAFVSSLREYLAPTLEEISRQSRESTTQTNQFVTHSTKEQVAGIQGIITQVLEGMDTAVGANLRAAGEHMVTVAQAQRATLSDWEASVQGMSTLLAHMRETGEHLNTGTERMTGLLAPVDHAAGKFLAAAEGMADLLPRIDKANSDHAEALAAIEATHLSARIQLEETRDTCLSNLKVGTKALGEGTRHFQETGEMVRAMVEQLQVSHAMAIDRITTGVDEAVLGSMQEAGVQLAAFTHAQEQSLTTWVGATNGLSTTIESLETATRGLDGLAARLEEASAPASAAAGALVTVSEKVNTLFPRMDETTAVYDRLNAALERTAGELGRSSRSYAKAGQQVSEVVDNLEKTVKLQVAGNKEMGATLQHATTFVQALDPATEAVVMAADRLVASAGESAKVLDKISAVMATQDLAAGRMKEAAGTLLTALEAQSSHLDGFLGEMGKLKDSLTDGMDGFARKLPESIDKTMVHFDAALGEGVDRLGSAVERLRESMDDLQEQLEIMLDSKRGRR